MATDPIYKFITSDKFTQLIEKVGAEFKLHIDQENNLYSLVQIFLQGHISADSFVENVKQTLEIDSRVAKLISQAVDEQILKPLRKELINESDTEEIAAVTKIKKNEELLETLTKQDILSEIENPTPAPSRVVGNISETEIDQHVLHGNTPKETADKIIEDALAEATAHEFKSSSSGQPTVPTKHAADVQHRIESHEQHVVFLPTEHVSMDAQNIIASVEEQPAAKMTNAAPEIKTSEQKKRPLSDIIPPNTPRKYSVDPYREPTN